MKRFLAILIGATSCSLCTYAQNGYIVTTTSQQTSISVESLEKQFILKSATPFPKCYLHKEKWTFDS